MWACTGTEGQRSRESETGQKSRAVLRRLRVHIVKRSCGRETEGQRSRRREIEDQRSRMPRTDNQKGHVGVEQVVKGYVGMELTLIKVTWT